MGPQAKDFVRWTEATSELPWGAQRALYQTLELVRDEKIHLAYGTDYNGDGSPCLINAASHMLSAVGGEGGNGKPSAYFSDLVGTFDTINKLLYRSRVNLEHQQVSPLAAEILLANFAPLKEQPTEDTAIELLDKAFTEEVYVEPSDEDLTREWLNAMSEPATPEGGYTSGQTSRNAETEVRDPNTGKYVNANAKRSTES